jgi:hypothetical protein
MHVSHCCSSKSSILFCDFFSLLEGGVSSFSFFESDLRYAVPHYMVFLNHGY